MATGKHMQRQMRLDRLGKPTQAKRKVDQPTIACAFIVDVMQLTHAQGQICPENSNYCLPWYAEGQLCTEYKICDGKAL